MSLAPWRSPLARALHRNRSKAYSRYPQLATVAADGRPANRTVVFRDFLPDTDSLLFVTDVRSAKVQHIAQQPYGELCWYFTKTREQFRLNGHLSLITAQDHDAAAGQIRQNLWDKLSTNGRQQFAWPNPGEPRTEGGYEPLDLALSPPLSPFAVLILAPEQVDHLELRGEPQNRHQYWQTADGGWRSQAINP
ncbi:Npun_F5749 family FMN-dependent PPOX-type flavoprotein [Leptolyngbya iicbica]|uniref:Pyridoxamine 5'-phosphate oxidase n=2 Tax=Cyanophyceae TaxID=3028117 RepID=A0A4V2E3A2_9CYAN|nr:Npun_F5749 family FMN-dependent PPOX-type flavoprotein [Leptolyngbya sp. LK]RZM81730.1 pyridoxamine 5'-phosphate oxidase [Leptolyngbya sp. LK]